MLTSQKLRLLVNELCCIVPICETYLYDDHIYRFTTGETSRLSVAVICKEKSIEHAIDWQ